MESTHLTIAQRKVRIIFSCGMKLFYSDLQSSSLFLPIAWGIEVRRSCFSEGLFCPFWPQEENFYIKPLRLSSQLDLSINAHFPKPVIKETNATNICGSCGNQEWDSPHLISNLSSSVTSVQVPPIISDGISLTLCVTSAKMSWAPQVISGGTRWLF